MIETIQRLEAAARALEPDPAQRGAWLDAVRAYAEGFLDELEVLPTYTRDAGQSSKLDLSITERPGRLGALLENLHETVDGPGINPASGGHLGYIPGGGVFPSALGDFLADVTNRFSGISFASPGAARMESGLVRWMAGLVGYPEGAGGDLTSGGSIANLSAVVTAREAMEIRARDIPDACVYMTSQAHHCVDRALNVAGLGECRLRRVPVDDRYRMDAGALERSIGSDRRAGLRPWLIVASAGTTDTGAVDPLEALAAIAERERLWLHLDAAYGGFFMLCEEGRAVLKGLQRSDSMVMDPHKGLFLPYGTGAVLVRDVRLLAAAHAYQADYMQDARGGAGAAEYSPADLSAELSRPFRGLRLWLPLKLFGLAAFRAALAEKIWLARYFHARLSELDGFEPGPTPELSVVTYRYVPKRGDADAFNRALLQAVHDDGHIFVSSTRLDGHFTLRLAVLNFRTHRAEIDYLLDLLVREAARLAAA
ncbi:MAG: amino acid decarboxylase [Xanthomonadales bacterium]|nr:amino acid decarboxylase [Xanthomonadales bacterium]NIN58966.1 amino acid decarboxylase [Xanthomonadales bacterium]NIN74231.1 amino acid decarboxylase [Xanthomonadales bacterium]NIO13904.1 amino acid decarboxylase [Xanthomonadales bacterium]NIP11359.1 amino acid decarboxylase [Xanthomonadales bacterium]